MKKDDLPDLTEYEIYQRMDCGDNIALFFKKKSKDFLLDITGETETAPEIGDLSIFWNKGKEWKA